MDVEYRKKNRDLRPAIQFLDRDHPPIGWRRNRIWGRRATALGIAEEENAETGRQCGPQTPGAGDRESHQGNQCGKEDKRHSFPIHW
jgi:hypothetical protein